MTNDKETIRLWSRDEWIIICPHIKIGGNYDSNIRGCEYTEKLKIWCDQCQKEYNYVILIN
jgi:hypothetical protein